MEDNEPVYSSEESGGVPIVMKGSAIVAMKGWIKIKGAAAYSGVSVRTAEGWLKQGLRFIQLPTGLRLTKYEWIDEFLERYSQDPANQIDEMVEQVLADIQK